MPDMRRTRAAADCRAWPFSLGNGPLADRPIRQIFQQDRPRGRTLPRSFAHEEEKFPNFQTIEIISIVSMT